MSKQIQIFRPLLARAVFFGFATSITMWVFAYLLHALQVYNTPIVVFFALFLTQYQGARVAGRDAGPNKRWRVGLAAGLVTGLINLLALGSLLADQQGDAKDALSPVLTAIGYLAFSGILGAVAGLIPLSSRWKVARTPDDRNWVGRFAILATAAAFVLLIVGGIVTSTQSGLAVPDWPSSFGANMFFFPLSKMTGGVFIEHAHRLLAVLVGLTTATLLVWTLLTRIRVTTKLVAIAAAALVIVQAVLGGIRVTDTSTALAMIHGVIGHIYVATLALLAAMLSTLWRSDLAARPTPVAGVQRTLNALALSALMIQIILGAAVRHFDLQMHALMTHMTWSVVALILLLVVGLRAQKRLGPDEPLLRKLGAATKHSALLQMTLGVAVLVVAMIHHNDEKVSAVYVAFRTPHQAVGNILLIAMTLLTAWTLRLTRSAPHESQK